MKFYLLVSSHAVCRDPAMKNGPSRSVRQHGATGEERSTAAFEASGAVLAASDVEQADPEGLTLLKANNKTGYFGVHLNNPGQPKPYDARVSRGG